MGELRHRALQQLISIKNYIVTAFKPWKEKRLPLGSSIPTASERYASLVKHLFHQLLGLVENIGTVILEPSIRRILRQTQTYGPKIQRRRNGLTVVHSTRPYVIGGKSKFQIAVLTTVRDEGCYELTKVWAGPSPVWS